MKEFERLNDNLQRVQIGRDNEVPIETSRNLWFLWIDNEGEWDADTITHSDKIIIALDILQGVNHLVFCIWHGEHRTNLFLMDSKN